LQHDRERLAAGDAFSCPANWRRENGRILASIIRRELTKLEQSWKQILFGHEAPEAGWKSEEMQISRINIQSHRSTSGGGERTPAQKLFLVWLNGGPEEFHEV